MDSLPLKELSKRPRRFLPEEFDAGDWNAIEPMVDRLEEELKKCSVPQQLAGWLLEWGELCAALDEESARRYIAMTCRTDDPDAERAYLQFVEEIEPRFKPRQFRLESAYFNHPVRRELPKERYEMLDRHVEAAVELFREENVPLETEESRIGQQYQKLSGGLTVQFQGEERTLAQMAPFLEQPDRDTRKEAWEQTATRRLKEAEKFEAQFDKLVQLREKIAENAGYPNYRDYAFKARARFDYTPGDCQEFQQAVEGEVVPLLKKLQDKRRSQIGVDSLRPWDLAVDPLGRPPLKPFQNSEELLNKTQEIFNRMDPRLSAGFRELRQYKLLDLENRKGKAPGGYQCSLGESRMPFIFMNAVGVQRDVETLLHEAGHAFHTLATREEPLYAYRHAPTEFCEVASMTMELIGGEFLEAFFQSDEVKRARKSHLEGIVSVLPWIATIDAFQHWIYTHPGHTRAERLQAWVGLMKRFGGIVDWSGYETIRSYLWHRQLHLFLHPFYYIEYGIAQLGALQVWVNWRKDGSRALDPYWKALSMGGSQPLPTLFETAGAQFRFTGETIRPLMDTIRAELAHMETVAQGAA